MQSIAIISVSSSDHGQMGRLSNAFLPCRGSYPRSRRKTSQQSRSKSALLSSELRPISSFELREKFPKIIKKNEFISKDENASPVSEMFKNEIKSAELLIKNRSQNDLLNMSNYLIPKENDGNHYNHKINCSSHAIRSANRSINSRIPRDNRRWKSATIESNPMLQDSISKEKDVIKYIKLLSLHPDEIQNLETNTDFQRNGKIIGKNDGLVTSVSNFLTNVLTIDDIHGVANEWTSKNLSQKYEINEEVNMDLSAHKESEEKSKPLINQSKRVAVLREYMNVYLNWRTTQSIEEHRDLIFGRQRKSRIKTSIPKTRLQIFNKILDVKQTTISKRKVSEAKDIIISQTNDVDKDIDDTHKIIQHTTPSKSETSKNDIHQNLEDEIKQETAKGNEESSQEDSDEYSEIDWLQSEDI